MTAPADKGRRSANQNLATNRKALRDYHILERFEAGIALKGAEVKSLRDRGVSANESYARIERGEVILHNLHILPYKHSSAYAVDPKRPRRLLLHRREIKRLIGQVAEKGHTLVPLNLYLKGGRVKVELGLCKGKLTHDKRETLRRKTADREAERAIASHRKNR